MSLWITEYAQISGVKNKRLFTLCPIKASIKNTFGLEFLLNLRVLGEN